MPIDIASGIVTLEGDDVEIAGKVALTWNRSYSTMRLDQIGALGPGWRSDFDATLTYRDGAYEFTTAKGAVERFPDSGGAVARGEVVRHLGAFIEIFRQGNLCVVQAWNVDSGEVSRHVFAPGAAGVPWRLRSVEDPTGQGLDLVWDETGLLRSVSQRLEGRELWPAYDRSGRIVAVELRSSGESHRLVSYEYNDDGRLAVVRDAADFPDRYEYDTQGRIVREIIKDGGVFHYRYDEQARCVRRAGLANYDEKRLRYIDGIRSTEVTDSHGRKTVYQHKPSGQAVRVVNPDGGVLTTDYDDHGRIVAMTDAMGATTRYAFDAYGNRCLIVDALGHATSLKFNDHHLATVLIDGRGHTWSRELDAMNRVIASVDPLGNRWKFVHDADGNVAEIVDPLGATKQQCFVSGVLKSASDWMGHFTNYRFDAFGQVVERTGSLGETTQLRYDAMGNPIQVQFADGSNIVAAYDHAGNLVRFVDANGHQKTWRYGPCNRLAERIDAVGGRVQYRWGSEIGWLDQVINEAGETYDFIRDEQGRVVEEVTFDGVHRRYRYDRSERVVAFTNGCGETVQIERDAVGRVVAQMLPDGNHHRFAYDETGAMIEAVNADIAVRFERDPLGRISKEFQGEEWVTTQWDAPGNQTRIESSFGLVANWVYDGNGLPVQLMTPEMGQAITITRDFNGREIRRHMPGGVCLDQRFDLLGQLTHQQVVASDAASVDSIFQIGAGGEIVRRNYQYDRSGNLTKINDGHWGTTQIQLDPADRLIGVLRDRGDNESYCYDASGNLSGIVDNGGPRTVRQIIHGQAGRVTKNGETRYEYDLNGRRCTLYEGFAETADITHYRWNVLDRLASVRLSSGIVWEYRYDAIGRRVSKRVAAIDNLQESASNRSFLWSGSSIIGESCQTRPGTSVKNISWIYAPLSFDLIGSIQNGEYHSILLDHLGTPCEALDSRANLVWRRRLTTWGYPREKMAPTANSNRPPFECQFTFPGQYFDDESKLSQNYFRYYDPTTARYVNHDPIGIQGGTSLYTYPTNPFNWVDRFGLAKKCSKAAAKEAADLTKHLGYAEKYGKGGVKELENGRIRYYGEVQPAKKVGEMAGRRYVHEYDAATGWSRGWHETVDHAGNVRQVRPELNNGSKTHYQFDSNGKYTRSW